MAISRSGELAIFDDNGRERERHKIPYGATVLVGDGEAVKLAPAWRPGTR